MPQGTNTKVPANNFVHNPSADTVLTAPAGGQADVELDFFNDYPDVAVYYLDTDGLPGEDWAAGDGEEFQVMAAASAGGSLRLTLTPPLGATAGEYPFRTRIMSGGVVIGGVIPLILRVDPPLPSPSIPSEPALPIPSEPPLALPEIKSRAYSQDDPISVIDLPSSERLDDPEIYEDPIVSEASVLDPRDGAVFSLPPGGSLLLRFAFHNDAPQERTYILDEDRSLESDWITLVQDQVNLTRNGRGEVSVRLTPPLHAEPGEYPFLVTIGPQGGVLTPCALTLCVLAAPAVHVSAKEIVVKTGPFAPALDFQLLVESAGNADTAFRIAVKATPAEAEAGTAEAPRGAGDLYETPQWRYLFDKEMETLRSPANGREPQPVPIRLRFRRKGIWWLGFRESHSVRIAAVPVTDAANGGKPGNTVRLTGVRWRLLPVPLFIAVPLLILALFLLSGGARTVDVAGTAYQGNDGRYWVVDPPGAKKNITLNWTASWFALLRLTARTGDTITTSKIRLGSGTFRDTVEVNGNDRRKDYEYRISRLIGGADQDNAVSFIYTMPGTPLKVIEGTTGSPLEGSVVSLKVPEHGSAHLLLSNAATREYRLDWYLVKRLSHASAYQFPYVTDHGTLAPHGKETEDFVIQRNPAVPLDPLNQSNKIVFITTDSGRPMLTVKLVPAP